MEKIEKNGKITDVEELEEVMRIIINTAEATNLNTLENDVTGFLLSQKQTTIYSVIINKIEGVTAENLLSKLKNKSVSLIICVAQISELSNGTIARVSYKRNDDTERTTSSMQRTYLKGQSGIENALEIMRDELRQRLESGEFEEIKEEKKEEPKTKKKLTF